jgi:5'-nucleotidase
MKFKRKPDLCVSGVNHGSNSSINVIYSGTMSAAVEAGRNSSNWLFPLDFEWNADFETMKPFIRKITLEVLENRLPQGVVLNVNFPKLTRTTSKESKYVVKKARWIENLINDKHHKEETLWL